MEIHLPQYLTDTERLEYIKILHKITNYMESCEGSWDKGYVKALHHIEMFLSGAIKTIKWNETK